MNLNLLILFGFIGSVICAQTPSTGLADFEQKLRTATSGELVSSYVNDPRNLPEYLDEMAAKPPNYTIPITDPYMLFRFYKGVLAHYKKTENDAGSRGTETINNKKAELAAKDREIEEFAKKSASRVFNSWRSKDPILVIKENYRASLQNEIDRLERTSEKAVVDLPKFQRFANRFNPQQQLDDLLKIEEVAKKYEKDSKRR